MGIREELDEQGQMVMDEVIESLARNAAIQFLRLMVRDIMGEDHYDKMAEGWLGYASETTSSMTKAHSEKFNEQLRSLIIVPPDD